VLEFWTSTDGDAVLVNLTGAKIGAMGRRLPGSAEMRIARYDVNQGRLIEGDDGFAVRCGVDEPGMLLSRVRADQVTTGTPLRSVFSRGDAWLPSNDLFARDRDGDHWLIEHVPALVPTAEGLLPTLPAAEALGDVEGVDLAVGYGATVRDSIEVTVAALTLRDGHEVQPRDFARALGGLDTKLWPKVVHIVDEIPVTTWYRPMTSSLRTAGLPAAGENAWVLDPEKRTYRPLSETARKRLAR
jgi:putative long chain acyl-CoA synthase